MAGRIDRLREGARNAVELLKRGRLGAPYGAAHEVVDRGPHHRLRRYTRDPLGPYADVREPLVLVPPLMVATEVYDISPELSAVAWLAGLGLDVWVVDFGAPEREEGGLDRTLDDHILAVDRAIDVARATSGADVHIAGYSQGGMFCYQVAAYRRSRGLKSVITFGSPVDLRRSLPVPVRDPLVEGLLRAVRGTISSTLEDLDGLPGAVTSTGFKVFGARKEVQQLAQLVRMLPDREALEKREPARRFLGGEGFVAWPGPAFREFVDRVIVENRMTAGGLVIGGRAVALADITVPVLYFLGAADDMARPAAVRGIRKAAPRAELHEVVVPAGHFGLVVGSRALQLTWPTVAEWMSWRAGLGKQPAALAGGKPKAARASGRGSDRYYQLSVEVMDRLWTRLGEVSEEVTGVVHAMRWQIPRMAQLESLEDTSRVSLGRAVHEQAAALPEEPFFLWEGRAFTWAQANARIDHVLQLLLEAGVAPDQHVAVWMDTRPDVLTVLTALSRLGAVAAVLDAAADPTEARAQAAAAAAAVVLCDRRHAALAGSVAARVLVLEGPEPTLRAEGAPASPAAMNRRADAGRAADLALLLPTDEGQAARITNRRAAMASLAMAAAGQLMPTDTLYTSLPLHAAAGLLVAVGGAVAGGCRLALARRFDPATFWDEVRRVGATVVVHDGASLAALVDAPPNAAEHGNGVRLWVGPPLPPSVHAKALARFGKTRLVAFYGTTEGNVVLADVDGERPGSVGKPLVPGARVALARYDRATREVLRGADGRVSACRADEPGLLLARIDPAHPVARFDGYADPIATEERVLRDVFTPGDAWFLGRDVLRRDREGFWWVVERRTSFAGRGP